MLMNLDKKAKEATERMTTQVTTTTTSPVDCIFCRIIGKEAPASILYEDDKALVFLDIRPLNQGHTLVIPKEHYETVYDMPEELVRHIYTVVKRMAVAVKAATKADGITIIQQNGHAAGQEIFHMHVHVVPRYEGQKLPHFRDIPNASREQLEQAAKKIREQFKN
jgi:histidine triad (HIT) family protein